MRNFVLILCAVLMQLSCTVSKGAAQSQHTEQVKLEKELAQAIDNRHFTIDVTYMTPMRGVPQSISGHSLTVKGDTIISQLPYFGYVTSAPYGGGDGLNFTAKITGYKQETTKKCVRLNIETRNTEDTYQYMVEIYPNGHTFISVTSRNRDQISFTGDASPN